MIRVTITPIDEMNFYGELVKKEKSLQTLYRSGPRKAGAAKWKHVKFQGWLTIQKSVGGITVACVQAKNPDEEWKILTSFIGVLDRNFRDVISNINIGYSHEV
jgi:hypothetical protein